MTQIVGAQVETELKCSADKFYNIFRHNIMQLTIFFPRYLKSVKIIKDAPSKVLMLEEIIKSVDEENRSVTFSVLGGDILTQFKSVDFIMAVTPKDVDNIKESGSKVRWWVQYEKRSEDVHSPDGHISLLGLLTKELGHYLLQQ
ncbi:hypothetical protein MKX01_033652 [Papaver californicum]|nr:hypothetical protein MKX01_033652 [Papaver californicum]